MGLRHIKTKTCPRYCPGLHCPCLDVCELPVVVCNVPVVDAGLRAVQAEVQVQPVLSNPDCLQLRVTVKSLVNPVKNITIFRETLWYTQKKGLPPKYGKCSVIFWILLGPYMVQKCKEK